MQRLALGGHVIRDPVFDRVPPWSGLVVHGHAQPMSQVQAGGVTYSELPTPGAKA